MNATATWQPLIVGLAGTEQPTWVGCSPLRLAIFLSLKRDPAILTVRKPEMVTALFFWLAGAAGRGAVAVAPPLLPKNCRFSPTTRRHERFWPPCSEVSSCRRPS